MNPALALFAFFIFGGLATYTISERRHRRRWFRFERRPLEDPAGPFRREIDSPPTHDVLVQRRAPATIRWTALWSIYMGQMALPGGLLGLFGVLFAGIGLVSIPGMILAVQIWRLGYALLRRDPGVAQKARELRRFAVVLNVTAVAIALGLFVLSNAELLVVSLVLVGYAAVSFAHAAAMERCATLIEHDAQALAAGQAHGVCAGPVAPGGSHLHLKHGE